VNAVTPKNRIYVEAHNVLAKILDLKTRNAWTAKPADLILATVSKKTVNAPLISYIRACLENFGYTNNKLSIAYDADLVTAIKAFQADNGLVADGVAGNMTWSYLGKTIDQLMTQAILNLDRTRWLPDKNAAEYIYVNLAKQTFQYFENEVATLSFKTINGRLDRATPLLVDLSREVVLNPTWTVPRSIFVKDKIPLLRQDANYSLNANMTLYSDIDGSIVDPQTVNWNLAPSKLPYTLVQKPGPWNALGFIKFPLTNGFAIYMHDTNDRQLFGETDRLRSSGCMRLEKPFEVAAKLLVNTKWTADSLKAASEFSPVQAEKPTSISLKRHVPVYAAYKTLAFQNGRLIGSNDPYEVDKAMYSVLLSGK
jgi:murein L,D-transpeptidase YcbB/YkuD